MSEEEQAAPRFAADVTEPRQRRDHDRALGRAGPHAPLDGKGTAGAEGEGLAVPAPAPPGPVAEATDAVEVLISEQQIQQRVHELGAAISEHFAGRRPILVGILRGSVVFMADLLRAMPTPVIVDFLAVSSYVGQASSGVVRLLKDLDHTITDQHVLLVEDIIDTGLTLNYVMRILETRRPASLQLCTLLNKPARRLIDRPIAFLGFDIPDVFVVGYGLDYDQRYRNLPYIGVLKGSRR